MKFRKLPKKGTTHMPQRLELDTVVKPETVSIAIGAWNEALMRFVSPGSLPTSEFSELEGIRPVVNERLDVAAALAAAIIADINRSTGLVWSPEARELFDREKTLWTLSNKSPFTVGARVCVDAGVPREAIMGFDPEESVGRSLAGDDPIFFSKSRQRFVLAATTLKKRMIHEGRQGVVAGLELLVEHTGCGGRGQMLANLDNFAVSGVFSQVMAYLERIDIHHAEMMRQAWEHKDASGTSIMHQDRGRWIGILTKCAQRQGYEQLPHKRVIAPIELYDKYTGNLVTGLDGDALWHETVLENGGFTDAVIHQLAEEGVVFSLQYQIQKVLDENVGFFDDIADLSGIHVFEDLQTDWLTVNKSMVDVVERLWKRYENTSQQDVRFIAFVTDYIQKATATLGSRLDQLESEVMHGEETRVAVERRLIHHLFRAFSYAWVLDTFTEGHPPGKHIEDHLATGDSGYLGIKQHIALGQGDINPPSALEMFTGRSVLLHSMPGHEGKPIVLFLKCDTSKPDNQSMTNEETKAAMSDFEELLKLWPYILIGDIVPYIVIRGKLRGGEVTRIGLSVLRAYENFVLLSEQGKLPDLVPAVNSKGEVVMVSAKGILNAGIGAGENLKVFRSLVTAVADSVSDVAYQKRLK